MTTRAPAVLKKGLSNFGQLAPLPQTIFKWILLSTLKYEFYTREGNIAHMQGVFYWFHPKSFKYGTGPTSEKKMTGSAQHIENG